MAANSIRGRLLAPALAAATAVAGAALMAVTAAASPPARPHVLRGDAFSGPIAARPRPIERVLGPEAGGGTLVRVPCSGGSPGASCFAARS